VAQMPHKVRLRCKAREGRVFETHRVDLRARSASKELPVVGLEDSTHPPPQLRVNLLEKFHCPAGTTLETITRSGSPTHGECTTGRRAPTSAYRSRNASARGSVRRPACRALYRTA